LVVVVEHLEPPVKPAPEYDARGYIYRGRVVARRPAQDPDTVWSCPTCAALVIDNDRIAHHDWHGRQAMDELTSLTEDMGLYEKD
jgi:hypothetical protein